MNFEKRGTMKEIMTTKEIMEYLDISDSTLRRWRANGLEFVRIGGSVFYLADSIKKYMQHNLVNEYRRKI